ncbi:hypothetical protein PYCCODRAFT_1214484 [Trametes coccinea BRFM310]|uniref:Uncharacterized protein n=1 Tax=Trametes coccinea (strain BRFM310) TaxID=1353009 RepID=A0A1Y2I6T8_TRAC3|nr:hypothetical protein PYCCODRAFT_1214484 [Trametes coccinea BRFM310]
MDAMTRVLRSVALPRARRFHAQVIRVAWRRPSLYRLLSSDSGPVATKLLPRNIVPEGPLANLALRTLDPKKLRSEDYLDLSDLRARIVDPTTNPVSSVNRDPSALDGPPPGIRTPEEPGNVKEDLGPQPILNYGRRRTFTSESSITLQFTAFPTNARGFLYYREHPRVLGAGSIRFRVTQSSDPRSFDGGVDLLTEDGLPWRFPLAAVIASERYRAVREVLARDSFLDKQLEAHVASLLRELRWMFDLGIGPYSQLVYELFEPFCVDLSDPAQMIYIVGDETIFPLCTREILVRTPFKSSDMNKLRPHWPYERGRITCSLASLSNRKDFALRVERILEPVRVRPDVAQWIQTVDEIQPRKLIEMDGDSRRVFRYRPGQGSSSVYRSILRRSFAEGDTKPQRPRSSGHKAHAPGGQTSRPTRLSR